jgi:tetratricopeptide (TPR) repeat protein
MKQNYLLVLFFFCLFLMDVTAQGVLEKIERMEKAVFSITAFGSNNTKNITASGFFISPHGIAVVPSYLFVDADSVVIKLRNGRRYGMSRIIASHKMANLSLIKVNDHRGKGFNFIIPTKKTEGNQSEVLILSDPEDAQAGISFGEVTKVIHAPYIDRQVVVDADYKGRSVGSPVINRQGQLIGIADYFENKDINYFTSAHVINDTMWINNAYYNWRRPEYHGKPSYLYPYMKNGLLNFMLESWVESAKYFTYEIKQNPNNVDAYILRGEARRRYNNLVGSRADFEKANRLEANHFLKHYFDAQDKMRNKKPQQAFVKYVDCIKRQQTFAPALIEFGLLAVAIRNDVETALECFNDAIKYAPLCARGYYERSRLLQEYFSDHILAMEDISMAIELNRYLPGAYSIRGTLRIQTEDYLEALADFDRAIELDSTDTHALFNRGIAFYNMGIKEKSCEDWEKAGLMGHYKALRYISRYCSQVTSKRVR